MKKLILLTIFCVMVSFPSFLFGQGFYHAIGGQANLGFYKLEFTSSDLDWSSSTTAGVPGVLYKASFGLSEKFAITAYPFLGINLSVNSQSGGSGSFGFDFPLNAELYFGEMDDNFFSMGAGFGFHYLQDLSGEVYGGGKVVGPQLALAKQFDFREKKVCIRVACTFGLNKSKIDLPDINITKDSKTLLSFGLLFPLGL